MDISDPIREDHDEDAVKAYYMHFTSQYKVSLSPIINKSALSIQYRVSKWTAGKMKNIYDVIMTGFL